MKRKFLYTLGMIAICSLPALAQPDTLTKPNRTDMHQDPKITDENSKVLLDTTSSNVVDSLLDQKRSGKDKFEQRKYNQLGDPNKPARTKRVPVDTATMARP